MKQIFVSLKMMLVMCALALPILACSFSDFSVNLLPEMATNVAPDFTVTTFDGQTITVSDLKGKVVVLNFWAGWCAPCLDQLPELQSAWEYYHSQNADVIFLGIAYVDTEASSRQSLVDYGITYLNAPDIGTQISDAYGITGVPETFVIDKQGNIAEHAIATITSFQIMEWVDTALEGDAP